MNEQEWPVFAGIDWGGSFHQLCVVDCAGKEVVLRQRLLGDGGRWAVN